MSLCESASVRAAMVVASAAVALAAGPRPAAAQVSVQMGIQVPMPPAPTLVFAAPGIQVVENWGEEVFCAGGIYWVRRAGDWYRAPTPAAHFVHVEPARVPAPLLRLPPGQYRHWQKAQARAARASWKAERERERAERTAQRHAHGGGTGHGPHE